MGAAIAPTHRSFRVSSGTVAGRHVPPAVLIPLLLVMLVVAVLLDVGIGADAIRPAEVVAILADTAGFDTGIEVTRQETAVLWAIRSPLVVLAALVGVPIFLLLLLRTRRALGGVGMTAQPRLAAHWVTVEIDGKRLLDDVSLAVMPGELIGLVGPNGAGKTTLLRALAGDLVPNAGSVEIEGRPLTSYAVHELALCRSVLPQQTILQFAFTAREIVEMGRSPHHFGADDEMVIDASLARTETSHLAERAYPTLSGGEQSRVTLARVLAQACPLLLLDEPTASLDIRHQQMVMEVTRNLAGEGTTIVAVLHDLNLAASYADRLAVLHQGRLVAFDTPWATMTESLLSEAFACPIAIGRHPVRDCPMVTPLASAFVAQSP